jgi:hypothetical protein
MHRRSDALGDAASQLSRHGTALRDGVDQSAARKI